MTDIPLGTRSELVFTVTDVNAISFLGHPECRVLATPWMIMYMEMTAREAVKPLLGEGVDTVGTEVNVVHVSGALIGSDVTFRAEVVGVEGRRVRFQVEARDQWGTVGSGTHERAIIEVERFAERLRAKRRVPPTAG
jgi:fluoroacetyl-CoA thioesterase